MQRLPIFFAVNDSHVCHAATTLISNAEHTNAPIHVHVFEDSLSPRRKSRLARLALRYGHVDLTFHAFNNVRLDACLTTYYPTRAIFARYFIAELFPEYAQALYADTDSIFEADVSDFFRLGTAGHAVAACPDMGLHIARSREKKARLFRTTSSTGVSGFAPGAVDHPARVSRAAGPTGNSPRLTIHQVGWMEDGSACKSLARARSHSASGPAWLGSSKTIFPNLMCSTDGRMGGTARQS